MLPVNLNQTQPKLYRRISFRVFILIVFLTLIGVVPSANASPTLQRLAGYTQYDTAAAIAQEGWSQSDYAVLAYGENFPDALAAVPLAYKYKAPILLTEAQSLTGVTRQTLLDLGVKNLFIAGGTTVVSASVADQLQDMGISVTRLAGYDKYETSVEIAKQMGTVQEISVVNGDDYADALSISVPSALRNAPIILVPGDYLPDSVKSYLSSRTLSKSYLLGNTGQIQEDAAAQFPNGERITGADKYARNIAVLKRFEAEFTFGNIFMATGNGYADALAGSAYAAGRAAPILLTDSNFNKDTADYLNSRSSVLTQLSVLGGEVIMPTALIQEYTDYLAGKTPGVTYTAAELAKLVTPSVVHIEARDSYGTPILSGSGFIVDSTGKIATNYQLIKDAYSAKVTTHDGKVYDVANVCTYDIKRDLAVVKINAVGLQPVAQGDSEGISIGDKIYTLGNYSGSAETMNDGLISTKSKIVENVNYIQITASVAAGIYGGVLLNEQAEAIGLTVAEVKNAKDLYLALPINTLKQVLTEDFGLSLDQLPRQSDTTSTDSKMTDQEFAELLNSKYDAMTIAGKTVRFTWKVNDYQSGSATISVHGMMNPTDLAPWLELIEEERRGEMMVYFSSVCSDISLNYPDTTFMGNVLYQEYYGRLPSTPFFPYNEVSYTTDGKWFVSHPVVNFYNLFPQGKSDVRVTITD